MTKSMVRFLHFLLEFTFNSIQTHTHKQSTINAALDVFNNRKTEIKRFLSAADEATSAFLFQ